MQNHLLTAAAAHLLEGEFYAPSDERTWALDVGFVALIDLVKEGPAHHLIGHRRGCQPIGAFTFVPIEPNEIPTHPALWSADAATQTRIKARPNARRNFL